MDLIAQSIAVNVLDGDEVGAFALADFVDVGDVRMIECSSGGGLLLEAAHSILISSNSRGQNLQRDFAMQPHVLRQINFAHATFAEQRANLIVVEPSIGSRCGDSRRNSPLLCQVPGGYIVRWFLGIGLSLLMCSQQ